MSLNQKEKTDIQKKYLELVTFYREIKEIVLLAEQLDKNQSLSIPAINELRNALDHIMRVELVHYGIEKVEKPYEYCMINLDKAHGHLYRAGYDGYDLMAISFVDQCQQLIESFDARDISAVFPDYYTRILHVIRQAQEEMAHAKSSKDVVSSSEEESNFKAYEKIVPELDKIKTEIERMTPIIIKHSEDRKKAERGGIRNKIIASVIASIIMLAIGFFAREILSSNDKAIANTNSQIPVAKPSLNSQKTLNDRP